MVSVLLQKNPNDRPSAKQLLHVPAMQPYVKRFLQCERDRIDSVASDISEITSRSTHDRSQIVSPGKKEKKCPMVNMTEESNASHQGEEIQMKHSQALKHPQQISSAQQRLSRTPDSQDDDPARVKAPKKQELPETNYKASKMHQPLSVNVNTLKARENFRARPPVDTRKHNLIKLTHALQRRHSEQISAHSHFTANISKVRTHSSGAQFANHSVQADDVFSVSESTIVTERGKDRCIATKPRRVKERGSSNAVYCKNRLTSVTQERKIESATKMGPRNSDEDMHRKKRNQSTVTSRERNRRPIEQRHRRLVTNPETDEEDKENVGGIVFAVGRKSITKLQLFSFIAASQQ